MQVLTSAVLAAFVAYAGAWYFGFLEGNFALLLFLAREALAKATQFQPLQRA